MEPKQFNNDSIGNDMEFEMPIDDIPSTLSNISEVASKSPFMKFKILIHHNQI